MQNQWKAVLVNVKNHLEVDKLSQMRNQRKETFSLLKPHQEECGIILGAHQKETQGSENMASVS